MYSRISLLIYVRLNMRLLICDVVLKQLKHHQHFIGCRQDN